MSVCSPGLRSMLAGALFVAVLLSACAGPPVDRTAVNTSAPNATAIVNVTSDAGEDVRNASNPASAGSRGDSMALDIMSPAFNDGGSIPRKYTCQGDDVNPPLAVRGVPRAAKSLVLFVDDPDAPRGTWDHWVVWNIDPQTVTIPEDSVPPGSVVGRNSWPKNAYGGPCPPSGTHRYFFKLYALDTALDLPSSATKADIERAMAGHMVGQAQLMGKYAKG